MYVVDLNKPFPPQPFLSNPTQVIKAGASTLNIPDTVGYTTMDEYRELIAYLVANTPGADKVIFSTHCHNDLGLATANTIAGILGGARQAEVTINGIGERAGNTSLEELIMAIKTRPGEFPVYVQQDTTQIIRTSRMVSTMTGMAVQPNKAIVGANAFAHEAGIHQDGVLKNPDTYEIMRPESVGLSQKSNLVLGKHSGKHAYKKRLEELGYNDLTDAQIQEFVHKFKTLADQKKDITDADIESIVTNTLYQPDPFWNLKSVHVSGGNLIKPTATVTLTNKQEEEFTQAAIGDGPVDAMFRAIDTIVKEKVKITNFTIQSVTNGTNSVGEATTQVQQLDSVVEEGSHKKLQREDSRHLDSSELYNPQTGEVVQRTHTG